MVRENKTKGDSLWFAFSFALGKVKVSYRSMGMLEGERAQACDATQYLRQHNQWQSIGKKIL
jgi:hypothetical protein